MSDPMFDHRDVDDEGDLDLGLHPFVALAYVAAYLSILAAGLAIVAAPAYLAPLG